MADKKISELPAAESLESTDLMMVAQENVSSSSGYVSMKTTAADVADEFNTELTYNDLNTTDKTIVGSINEVKGIAESMVEANPAGSASIVLDKIKIGNTTYEIEDTGSIVSVFQTLGTGTEIGSITVDNVETKFYAPTPTEVTANPQDTATDTLTKLQIGDDVYDIGGSSSGGHTILDNDGTALTQRDELQFIGAYSEDDNTNEITKVNIVREMTKAQFDLLSADEKVGLIRTTDEINENEIIFNMDYRAGSTEITSTNNASYNVVFDKSLNTVDYNVYLQSINYNSQGFATMGYAVTNRTINGFTFTVYNTDSFNAHTIGWIAIPQNINGISTNNKINYSTNEQKTGQKWIDGKDIYQRTYELNADIPTTGWYSLGIDASNMDFLVDTILCDNGAVFKCYSVAKLDGLIKVENSRKSGGIHANAITIQYTKTT